MHTALRTLLIGTRNKNSKRESMNRKKAKKLEWEEAPDIKKSIIEILDVVDMKHVNTDRIFC